MGTLDDAIREHLELKRRLGASQEEIDQKQSEAFGKGTRPQPPPAETAAAPAPAEPPAQPEQPFVTDDLAAAEPAPNGRSAQPGIETAEWEPPAEPADALEDDLFEPDEVPPAESLEPQLTVRDERDAGPVDLDEQPPSARDDVLEETPEFLEETPEHDRLWFEQRPPKDFDFD